MLSLAFWNQSQTPPTRRVLYSIRRVKLKAGGWLKERPASSLPSRLNQAQEVYAVAENDYGKIIMGMGLRFSRSTYQHGAYP